MPAAEIPFLTEVAGVLQAKYGAGFTEAGLLFLSYHAARRFLAVLAEGQEKPFWVPQCYTMASFLTTLTLPSARPLGATRPFI